MNAEPHRPEPEADDDSISIFGFDDDAWVGLMREAARPGDLGTVAGYQVLEEVNRGGQGVVFRAREESSGRVVALKRLAAGSLAGAEARARFQREIEADAWLRHPHIVGYQGVELVEGQPLLVMEWIDGLPADRWAREAGEVAGPARPVREVLAAFARISDAVAYAHQRGVIHRDLKPSNILIDGTGEPHVLDFGLARWRPGTARVGPEISHLTRTGGFVGTPAYAAPEQLTPGADGADVRADVYALGTVLYEMLSGRRPFEESEGDWELLLKAIREETPAPPSYYDRRVGGEVDAIVLRAMAKDPARRYQSAHELSADVRRYLAGEPVEARRDSAWYVARKFVRRHRVAVSATALVVLSLAVGMAGTTLGLMRAEERRVEAELAREQTQKVSDFHGDMLHGIDIQRMGRAIKERYREQVRLALERQYVGEAPDLRPRTPEEVVAELAEFDRRADAAQAVDVAQHVMDEFVLAPAAGVLEEQFADQPLVQAEIRFSIGRAYRDLGLYSAAEPHLRAALDIRRAHYGPGAHTEVAECLYNLGELMGELQLFTQAEDLYLESLAMWKEIPVEHMVPMTLDALVGVFGYLNRVPEAASYCEEALRLHREMLSDDHPETINSLVSLGAVRCWQERFQEAEDLERQALTKYRQLYSDDHPKVAHVMYNQAHTMRSQGKHAEALEKFKEVLGIYRTALGDEDPRVAKTLFNIGVQLAALERRREAQLYFEQALAQQRKWQREEHPDLRATMGRLALLHQAEGNHDKAVELLSESLDIADRSYPDGHPDAYRRFSARVELGRALARHAKALLPADRPRALAMFQEADPHLSDGVKGQIDSPRTGSRERKRQTVEHTLKIYEFWHGVAPDRGWGDRAAEWRAELEKLSRP